MMRNPSFVILLSVISTAFLLDSCVNIGITEQSVIPNNTPIIMASALPPISTRVPSPLSPTAIPTLSSIYEEKMAELLESKNCELPCYLSIQPGKAKAGDAKILLESLGASYFASYQEGNSRVDEYHLDVGDKSLSVVTPITGLDTEIPHRVLIVVDKEGVVQQIRVGIDAGGNLVSKFKDYWSKYSTRELLSKYGIPDTLNAWASYGGGYGFGLIYEKQGIVIELNGSIRDSQICPESETVAAGLHFTLTNTSSGMSIFDPDWAPSTDPEHWFSTLEVIGITSAAFYNQIVAQPSVCFDIKKFAP
jgi:hypothetical protein